ncbi:MAG: DUF255 domain-containing protein [Chitinophagaceae bacterium]
MPRIIASFLLFITLVSFKGNEPAGKITWLSLSEAETAAAISNKPILIDLYTDWCVWCKVMDKRTYTNNSLAAYVQGKFYAVKINAETKTAIKWSGRSFNFSSDYKVNEFAIYVTGGRLVFPTTVIIPSNGSAPQAIPGYLKPKELELFLKYFGEGFYKHLSVEEYMQTARSRW